jgi:hypothetical protein
MRKESCLAPDLVNNPIELIGGNPHSNSLGSLIKNLSPELSKQR